jgi:uncharacterized OB-fold protein/acyl dehydratase
MEKEVTKEHATETSEATWLDAIRRVLRQQSPPCPGPDAVNAAMIRHWCEALGDRNPVYTHPAFAERSVHRGIVAPPAMLDAWVLNPEPPGVVGETLKGLDAAGFTSVVATNAEHEYDRYLRLGDRLISTVSIVDISEEKQTALGRGHFFTNLTEIRDQEGKPVGRVRMRILKFNAGTARPSAVAAATEPGGPPALRPRPGISHDTRFFWEGVERGELRVQRCEGCRTLHHPPVVRCPECGSYAQGFVVASGRGTVYSFVEPCHPKMPAFPAPYVVGLVELEEGTRLLTNIVDVDPELVEIGMPVEIVFRTFDPDLPLPVFRPRTPARRETTLAFDDVAVGDKLPLLPVPITTTLIIAGAIASRDFTAVHHDVEVARAQGVPDIFMNILTTGGLVSRYVTDWAGPEARLRKLAIRLGAPNCPGDTMTFSGSVTAKQAGASGGGVEVSLRGTNRLGTHVAGTIAFELPGRSGRR